MTPAGPGLWSRGTAYLRSVQSIPRGLAWPTAEAVPRTESAGGGEMVRHKGRVEFAAAPSTMLRLVPLPRFTVEDPLGPPLQ